MIIQTGLRTDIPAFYTPWFLRRLQEGFVLVRNPYAPRQVTRYSLSPEVVDCIGFCTKNPAPMLPHLDRLAGYGQFWYVTITPYGADIHDDLLCLDCGYLLQRFAEAVVGRYARRGLGKLHSLAYADSPLDVDSALRGGVHNFNLLFHSLFF